MFNRGTGKTIRQSDSHLFALVSEVAEINPNDPTVLSI